MSETFPKLERKPVLEARLPEANPSVRLVKGARIRFAPGQPTGRHRHPMSTCGVVTAGRFLFQAEEKTRSNSPSGILFSNLRAARFSSSTMRRDPNRPRSSAST